MFTFGNYPVYQPVSIAPSTTVKTLPNINQLLKPVPTPGDYVAVLRADQVREQQACSYQGGVWSGWNCVMPVAQPTPLPQPTTVTPSVPVSTPQSPLGGQTTNTYVWGNCTWYVASLIPVPDNWGNADNWYSAAQAAGYVTSSQPSPGDIAWLIGGDHVAYVQSVDGDNVTISEMNFDGEVGVVHVRTTPLTMWLYISV